MVDKKIYLRLCILTLLFPLSVISAYASDFSEYPDMFLEDGKFNGVIVVGEEASSADTIGASDIASSLQYHLSDNENTKSNVIEVKDIQTMIDSGTINSAINTMNIISVGNSCNNRLSHDLMQNPQPCLTGYQEGVGLIKIYNYFGHYQILVGGYRDEDTRNAAEFLSNWKDHDMKGNEIWVSGFKDNPFIDYYYRKIPDSFQSEETFPTYEEREWKEELSIEVRQKMLENEIAAEDAAVTGEEGGEDYILPTIEERLPVEDIEAEAKKKSIDQLRIEAESKNAQVGEESAEGLYSVPATGEEDENLLDTIYYEEPDFKKMSEEELRKYKEDTALRLREENGGNYEKIDSEVENFFQKFFRFFTKEGKKDKKETEQVKEEKPVAATDEISAEEPEKNERGESFLDRLLNWFKW